MNLEICILSNGAHLLSPNWDVRFWRFQTKRWAPEFPAVASRQSKKLCKIKPRFWVLVRWARRVDSDRRRLPELGQQEKAYLLTHFISPFTIKNSKKSHQKLKRCPVPEFSSVMWQFTYLNRKVLNWAGGFHKLL